MTGVPFLEIPLQEEDSTRFYESVQYSEIVLSLKFPSKISGKYLNVSMGSMIILYTPNL